MPELLSPAAPSGFSLSSLVVPACAVVAVGLFLAATGRFSGFSPNKRLRKNGHRKAKQSGRLKPNRKRSMASRGILVVPKEGL